MGRWFISYWPDYCDSPASFIKEGHIEELIDKIQKRYGTIIFFYKLPNAT